MCHHTINRRLKGVEAPQAACSHSVIVLLCRGLSQPWPCKKRPTEGPCS